MKKLLLLFAVLLGTVGAWGEGVLTIGEQVSNITTGKYVLYAMCNHGKGLCTYRSDYGGSRFYRIDTDQTIVEGNIVASQYIWDVEVLDGGKITIKWSDDNTKFFPKDNARNQNFTGNTLAEFILEPHTIDGKDYYALTLEDTNIGYIHANAPGGHPNLSYWNSYGDDGTCVKFQFYSVKERTSVNVTYNFIYNGVSRGTEDVECAIGAPFTAPTTLPDYVVAELPNGEVTAEDEGEVIDLNCNLDLPFSVSESYENAVWYNMSIRSNDLKWVIRSETSPYSNVKQQPNMLNSNAMWAFVGNPFDGIKVLNKAAGSNFTLSFDEKTTDSPIYMKETQTSWIIEKGNGGFVLRQEGATEYAHDYSSSLKFWVNNSAKTDPGSAFQVYECEFPGVKMLKGEEMQNGKIYRIQSTTHETFTGINGYTCQMQNQAYNSKNPGQLWKYVVDGNKAYLQNVYAGLYPQNVPSGGSATTTIGAKKTDCAFTYQINGESEDVWNIYFDMQVNIEANGNVNYWYGENAHHYIYEVEITDEALATMCMDWYNANKYTAPEATADTYQKIDVDANATVIISPSEFAAPSVINEAIDNLLAVEGDLNVTVENVSDIHTLFAALAVYAPAKSALTAYKDAVTDYGELLSIAYTPKAEWGTIILPINWAKPEGWTRYSCAETEGNVLTLTEFPNGGANKNTPMIIQVAEDKIGTTYQLIGYSDGAGTENVDAGLLTGVLEDNTIVPDGSYVLARQKSTELLLLLTL